MDSKSPKIWCKMSIYLFAHLKYSFTMGCSHFFCLLFAIFVLPWSLRVVGILVAGVPRRFDHGLDFGDISQVGESTAATDAHARLRERVYLMAL